MKNKINGNIKKFVTESIQALRTNLSQEQLSSVKSEFIDIYNCKIATSDSYYNLVQSNKIPMNKQLETERAFVGIGNLIAIPARTGTTNLLNDAYAEDVKDPLSTDFLSYQMDVVEYVYDQVITM